MVEFQNLDRKLNILFVSFFVIIAILLYTTLENGRVSCKYYLPNIYLYLVLSILIVGIITLVREKYFTPAEEKNKLYDIRTIPIKYYVHGFFFGFLGIILLFLYGFFGWSFYKNHWLNHLVWLIVLFGIATLFYPLFKIGVSNQYMDEAAIYVISIFLVMSGVIYAYRKKVYAMSESVFSRIGMGLMVGLLAIIFASLFLILFEMFGVIQPTTFLSLHKIILYVAIFLFSLFISYDTGYIIRRQKSCNANNVAKYPNYPMESFQIFIDLYNIFADLLQLEILRSIDIT